MNKRILAVAVAGALAAPAAAFAQSSVTISGLLKGGFENLKLSNSPGAGRAVSSQTGVVDDASRIIFNVVEDLGGGMQAIGQLDFRPSINSGTTTISAGTFLGASGNTHVGIRSKSWGRLFIGRQDLHYFNRESSLTDKASLRADSISILSYVANPAGSTQAIANATRTPDVVHYTTPNWGGFTLIAAYSNSPAAAGAAAATDITGVGVVPAGTRHGRAWTLNPNFQGSHYQVGWSTWNERQDLGTAANSIGGGNQKADRLYGSYRFAIGLRIGLAYDNSKITGAFNGQTYAKRTAWSLPIEYSWGAHNIYFHYDRAGADKSSATLAGSVQAANGNADSKATMWALAYAYDLSKRTSLAVEYARINNHPGANYNFFTSTSLGVGSGAATLVTGEKPRTWGVTMRHQF
jgi:predicted porin